MAPVITEAVFVLVSSTLLKFRYHAPSGTDHAPVLPGNHHASRARFGATTVREMRWRTFFAWVLNAHEHGFVIRRECQPCNFTSDRSGQEAAHFARHRVTAQHLVIALPGKIAFVRVVTVRLNPQTACAVEPDTIR